MFNNLKKKIQIKQDPIGYARKLGVSIGENCQLLTSPDCFGSEPWLIRIGDHVEITYGVRFITHDGGAWVLRDKHQDLDVFGNIVVGNNVFIGMNSIILPGVHIGDNCVIGAGSVVTRDVPSDSVAAGVPARRIGSLEEYEQKMLQKNAGTKRLPIEEKRAVLEKLHPQWFV